MDIDDILDSLNRDDNIVLDSASLDHQQLTRFWVTERGAPELLPWPGPLMDRMMERVRKQVRLSALLPRRIFSSYPQIPGTRL